jgi:hypothetical protein
VFFNPTAVERNLRPEAIASWPNILNGSDQHIVQQIEHDLASALACKLLERAFFDKVAIDFEQILQQ